MPSKLISDDHLSPARWCEYSAFAATRRSGVTSAIWSSAAPSAR